LATTDYSLAHSLPANVEAERSILGAILLDNFSYNQAAEHLKPEDFSLDSHRRIYARMMDLAESSRPIDMITLVEEFDRHKELEAIGDVGYISGLVDGVPDRPSIEHYIKIVRDKALLRGLIHAANSAIARAADQSDPAEEVLNDVEAAVLQLSEKRIGRGFMGVQEIVRESFGSVDALRRTLLAARAIAHTVHGASGMYVPKLKPAACMYSMPLARWSPRCITKSPRCTKQAVKSS